MICKNCGKEMPDTAKFCGGCGASLQSEPAEAIAEETISVETEPASEEVVVAEPEISSDDAGTPDIDSSISTSNPETPAENAGEEKKALPRVFAAAGSGANPFASITGKLNSQLEQVNASVQVNPFDGNYAKNAEADDIAAKARKAKEERTARRAAKKEKIEQRHGKKPVIAGFAEEPETEEKQASPLAEALPEWDLLPASGFFVDRSAS